MSENIVKMRMRSRRGSAVRQGDVEGSVVTLTDKKLVVNLGYFSA